MIDGRPCLPHSRPWCHFESGHITSISRSNSSNNSNDTIHLATCPVMDELPTLLIIGRYKAQESKRGGALDANGPWWRDGTHQTASREPTWQASSSRQQTVFPPSAMAARIGPRSPDSEWPLPVICPLFLRARQAAENLAKGSTSNPCVNTKDMTWPCAGSTQHRTTADGRRRLVEGSC